LNIFSLRTLLGSLRDSTSEAGGLLHNKNRICDVTQNA